MEPDPYAILQCAQGASQAELKAAWHARLREHHPDRFGAAPEAVRTAAENMTGLINQAYHSLSQRQGTPRRSHQATARRGQPPSAQGLPVAEVLTDYAAELIERWVRELSGIRGRRHRIQQARQVVDQAGERLASVVSFDDSLLTPIRSAIRRCFTVALVEPIQRIQQKAELIAQRVEGIRPGKGSDRALAQVSAEVNQCLRELREASELRAERMESAHLEAERRARSRMSQYERHLGEVDRTSACALNAVKRARALNRTAQEDGRRVPDLINDAREAVDRAQLLAGTALGLAKAERVSERESEGIWRGDRLVKQADGVVARLVSLDAEQQRADAVLPILASKLADISEMTAEIRTLNRTLQETAASNRVEYQTRRDEVEAFLGKTVADVRAEVALIDGYIKDSLRYAKSKVDDAE